VKRQAAATDRPAPLPSATTSSCSITSRGGGGVSVGVPGARYRSQAPHFAINHDPRRSRCTRRIIQTPSTCAGTSGTTSRRTACGEKHVAAAWFSPDWQGPQLGEGAARHRRQANPESLAWTAVRWAGESVKARDASSSRTSPSFATWRTVLSMIVRRAAPRSSAQGRRRIDSSPLSRLQTIYTYTSRGRILAVLLDYGSPTKAKPVLP